MDDLLDILGPRLARLRSAAGHTQESLAERLDVCRTTISCWERGSFPPSLRSVLALCDALRATPDEILGYQPPLAAEGCEHRERAAVARLAQEAPIDVVRVAARVLALVK